MNSKTTGWAQQGSANNLWVLVCVLALLGLILPGLVTGAPMTLEDCIARALDKNLNILEGEEALSEAVGGVAEARSGFLPRAAVAIDTAPGGLASPQWMRPALAPLPPACVPGSSG